MRILCFRFGRRITFCFAFVIKLLAAVLAGVVNNYYGFLVGRFFQGVGSMAGYQTGLVIRKWHDDVIKWSIFRVTAALCIRRLSQICDATWCQLFYCSLGYY